MPKLCPRHDFTWDVSCTANAISQIRSYMGVLISVPTPCPRHILTGALLSQCQRHIPDMVLHGTSHNLNDSNSMFQTWSYMRSHHPNVM
ncbi:hypothetical protein Gotur_023866, partial [Gossypium turneri]